MTWMKKNTGFPRDYIGTRRAVDLVRENLEGSGRLPLSHWWEQLRNQVVLLVGWT